MFAAALALAGVVAAPSGAFAEGSGWRSGEQTAVCPPSRGEARLARTAQARAAHALPASILLALLPVAPGPRPPSAWTRAPRAGAPALASVFHRAACSARGPPA
jgi:hypothetical protein